MALIKPDQRAAFNVEDAADYAGIKRTSIYRFLRERQLRDVKIGGRRVILREDLDKLLAENITPHVGGAR